MTIANGHVRSFHDNTIFDNGATYAQSGRSVDFFTDKALAFIAAAEGPCFAYIPFPAPSGHWPATNDGRRNRFAELHGDCPMNSVPRLGLSAAAVANDVAIKSGGGEATGHVADAERAGASDVFKGRLADPDRHPRASLVAPRRRRVAGACWRRTDGARRPIAPGSARRRGAENGPGPPPAISASGRPCGGRAGTPERSARLT